MKRAVLILLIVATAGCLGGMGDTTPTGETMPDGETSQPSAQETASPNETNETEETSTEDTNDTAETTQEVQTFTLLADDNGYYQDGSEISSITIPEGSPAQITFRVEGETYYGGLDFRSSVFDSPTVEPGGEWTSPVFTMQESFTVSSYWPESEKHKADLAVDLG